MHWKLDDRSLTMVITSAAANPWISVSKPNPQASLRMFCFPYAGGGASIFYKWADYLPKNVEVCPISLPGRGLRLAETPATRMSPLICSLAESLIPSLDKPFVFFGHSMGALISFELARYLRSRDRPEPSHLFVSGRNAPQLPLTDPPLYTLPESDFLEGLRSLNGTPQRVLENTDLMRLLLPCLQADFH
jgi:medium-chain acyl-[acyl-carrier-protein] hydrolase